MSGKIRDGAKKVNINNIAIDTLLDHSKEFCLYYNDIQERNATRWKQINYSDFQFRHAMENAATAV